MDYFINFPYYSSEIIEKIESKDKNKDKSKALNKQLAEFKKIFNKDLKVKVFAKSFLHDLHTSYIARERNDYFSKKDEIDYEEGLRQLLEVEKKDNYQEIFVILEKVNVIVFENLMVVWKQRQSIAVKNGENCNSILPFIMQILIEKMFDILEKIEKKIEMSLNDSKKEVVEKQIKKLNREMVKKSFIIEVMPRQICRKSPT